MTVREKLIDAIMNAGDGMIDEDVAERIIDDCISSWTTKAEYARDADNELARNYWKDALVETINADMKGA